YLAELPLTVQLVSARVPPWLYRPPPAPIAELPLMVQLVRVSMPPTLYRPPPELVVLPPVMVRPEIDAVTSASTWNTRLAWLPLTDSRPAPGPVIVMPGRLFRDSWPPVRVIVRGVVPKTDRSNAMVSGAFKTLARLTAWRSVIRPGALPT